MVDWESVETWGTHVHESEWGTWLPEKMGSNNEAR